MTYLYCILTPADAPPSLIGVAGAPVRALRVAGDTLEAWVATVDRPALRVNRRALAAQVLMHDQVVSAALVGGRTPLPVRFGSLFSDDASCIATLAARGPQLRGSLERLAGTIEMSVLVAGPRTQASIDVTQPARNEASAGRRYLERVRARTLQLHEAQAATHAVLEEVRRCVQGIVSQESSARTARGITSIAHLLLRHDEARYRRAVERLLTRNDLRVVVAGPRAPYNFAGPIALLSGHDSGSPDHNG